jgi:hypothetical protein
MVPPARIAGPAADDGHQTQVNQALQTLARRPWSPANVGGDLAGRDTRLALQKLENRLERAEIIAGHRTPGALPAVAPPPRHPKGWDLTRAARRAGGNKR